MTALLFIAFFLFLLLSVPVSIALILAAAVAMMFASPYSLDIITQKLFAQSDSFPLLAIPFFVLAGGIMGRGGMSTRLIRLASTLVGQVRGGMAMVSVVACMFFASISGSTAATTAAIGAILMPAIVRTGFSPGAATGLQATAGSIGIIIPPSIPFVLMGVVGGISIGELFLGGIIPGILVGGALMGIAHVLARVQKHEPSGERASLPDVLIAFKRALLALLTVVFVVGSIMLGIVVPTEAAVIAVIWSLLVSIYVYRDLGWGDMPSILADTLKITGIVVFCIGATAPFAWLLTVEQVPMQIAEAMVSLTGNTAMLKLMMLVVLLLVGTFLDLTPAMLILVPIFQPIAKQLGMDPVQFGVMVVMALGIGQSTPPVGISLFVACSVGNTKLGQVIKPLMPFLIAMIVILLMVAFIPWLSVGIPAISMR